MTVQQLIQRLDQKFNNFIKLIYPNEKKKSSPNLTALYLVKMDKMFPFI
ncbi:hypothetical protein MY539_08960 [Haemophilus influenzae]